ncbi:hypothetical protein [Methanobrevibacter ruminantium]|uniref:hypothetical protein n=1 Tax=Methanobrevibacter ruminantium TaxID=83816 RepID=UPI0026EF2632|nr:hypothetical protein [Methanobrevibacter ruminantium]
MGGIFIDISIFISIIAAICSFFSIIFSFYLHKRSLNVPVQRKSILSFINLLENEIKEHDEMEQPRGNAIPLEYLLYYGEHNSQNHVILSFIKLLNDFKETSEYQFLDKKHKKEINKIIDEWSNFSSEDVSSPEIYIAKLKDIKRTFVDYL